MKNISVPLRSVDFYNAAFKALAEDADAETFEYNDWSFKLDETLDDFCKDVKRGMISAKVFAR